MARKINFSIDDRDFTAEEGAFIVDAARENGVYIPTLCNYQGINPAASCRMCTVKVNGRPLTACTTPIGEGMEIENETPELTNFRKAVVELMFTEGNHYCPSCEKSGHCDLQGLAYHYRIMAPRFPYQFNERNIDASHPKIVQDHNRCILCKRCIRAVKDEEGRSVFTFAKKGHEVHINLDDELGDALTDELAEYAMEVCPVGAILVKKQGFTTPIGERKYDKDIIGHFNNIQKPAPQNSSSDE